MSDVQTCLASCVVSAGAPNGEGIEAVERQIDAYLANSETDRRAALLALKSAFEEMKFDGGVAVLIAARLNERLSEIADPAAAIGSEDPVEPRGAEI